MTLLPILSLAFTLNNAPAFAGSHEVSTPLPSATARDTVASPLRARATVAKRAASTAGKRFNGKPAHPATLPTLGGEYLATNLVDQTMDLESGWTIISFQSLPTDTEVGHVLSSIDEDLMLIKDNVGNMYMPEANYNGIGDLEFGQGYFVNMKFERTLTVRGRPADPSANVMIHPGWNTIGTTLAQSIDAGCLDAYLQAHVPGYSAMLMVDSDGAELDTTTQQDDIGVLEPGFGYQLHLEAAHTIPFTWADIDSFCTP